MRSIRTYMVIIAAVSMMICGAVILSGQFVLFNQLNNQFEENQMATLFSVEYALNDFMEEKAEIFERIITLENPEIVSSYLLSFEDLYYIDESNTITKIIQTNSKSRIFVGYGIVSGDLSKFIKMPAKGVAVSSIIRSAESDSVSIYLMKEMSEGKVIARLDLSRIKNQLEAFAKAFEGILIISSNEGYILTSTQEDLPFKIMPSEAEREAILGQSYQMTILESTLLENQLVLLTPIDKIKMPIQKVIWILPLLLSVILLLVFIQFITVQFKLLKPIKLFIEKLSSLDPSGLQENETALVENFYEVSELYTAFYAKTQELVATFEALDEERNQAINYSIENEKFAALGSLVAGVAHELNTPVGICITASSYLKLEAEQIFNHLEKGVLSKSELEKFVKDLIESLDVMTGTLDRASTLIQSFKQLAVDQSTDPYIHFDLLQQIDLVLASLRHELKLANCSVKVSCEDDITIKGHPSIYQQIFTNLIINAIIHGFKERASGEIWVDVQSEGACIIIRVGDNGNGVPEENRKRIFDPFFTTNRGNGGSGLGLNIVYNLVTARLKGTIKLISAEGVGAVFEIIIPNEEK